MNHQILLASLCLALLSAAHVTAEDNRFALVIGNGDYEEGRLKNPTNDAALISKSLAELGFNVETKTDLDQQAMEETISSFSRRLPKNSFAFFFFAGHGIQAKKANYLIPVGATLNSESSLKYRTVPLDFVRDELENSRSNLNVVVLDCCRNNPFERSWNRSLAQRGFAPLPPVPEGTVIAFATGEGKTASDGDGDNSPYTRELATALSSRPAGGLSLVEGVFFTLGRTLKPKTKQHPHLYVDSTMPKYYLWQPEAGAAGSSAQTPSAVSVSKPAAINTPTVKIAAKNVDMPKPAATGNSTDESSPEYQHAKLRLEQADRFHSEGQFDLAIEAYGALISDAQIPRELRDQSRRGRGGSHLAHGTRKSINLAIIDFHAAGERGIQIPVKKSEAELKIEKDAKGKIRRNEIVLITKSRGDWLWVASAQGNRSRQGWVSCSAFLSEPAVSSSGAGSISSLPSTVSPQPSAATTKIPSAPIQAFGTDPLNLGSSSGGSIVQFDSNGRIISPQSVSSQSVSSQSQNGHASMSASNTNARPSGPQLSTGQKVTYDANGRQIIQQSNGYNARSLSPNQPNIVYTDQYGNPVNQASTQSQRSYTPSNQQQRQKYQQPQQPYTQQNRNTQNYQPQSSNGFGNSGNMSLKDLGAERRDFDREVSRYQWQNGPLSPAERREVQQYRRENDRAKSKAFWGN